MKKNNMARAVFAAVLTAAAILPCGCSSENGKTAVQTADTEFYAAESTGIADIDAPAESVPSEISPAESTPKADGQYVPPEPERKEENKADTAAVEEPETAVQTAPAPAVSTEKPKEEYTCTLSVRCDTVFDNENRAGSEKNELIPADGVIFAERTVTFTEGESVFDVTVREMKNGKIHMEFSNAPIYNSAYIEGIGNLYEFDFGELSGWMYKVNGDFPNYGCSNCRLKNGDRVEWVYTCDLGADVGGSNY